MKRLLKALRSGQGVTTLETFFSIGLIVASSIVVVGIASVMNNQSVLNGAAQMAAQQALVYYDRNTYRGNDIADTVRNNAELVAASVATEDSRNMIASQVKGDTAPSPATLADSDFSITCGPDFSDLSAGNCTSAGPNFSRAEKVTVTLHAQVKLLMLDIGGWIPGVPSAWTITATSYAVSEGPVGR